MKKEYKYEKVCKHYNVPYEIGVCKECGTAFYYCPVCTDIVSDYCLDCSGKTLWSDEVVTKKEIKPLYVTQEDYEALVRFFEYRDTDTAKAIEDSYRGGFGVKLNALIRYAGSLESQVEKLKNANKKLNRKCEKLAQLQFNF